MRPSEDSGMTATNGFQPKILGFLCNWCSYAGADLAGVSRFQYPPTIRIIRVMCSGRVDPTFVVRAFLRGVDGVMVLGCHPGDCHYTTGNYYARNRMEVARRVLGLAGVNTDRLALDWVSAGEGQRFATLVIEFTEQVRVLGPLGQGEGLTRDEMQDRLAAARRVLEHPKVRWLIGRKRELLDKGDVYGQPVSAEEYEAELASTVDDQYLRSRLLGLTADRALSVKQMAGELGMAPRVVLPHVVALEQEGLVSMDAVEELSPKYRG